MIKNNRGDMTEEKKRILRSTMYEMVKEFEQSEKQNPVSFGYMSGKLHALCDTDVITDKEYESLHERIRKAYIGKEKCC